MKRFPSLALLSFSCVVARLRVSSFLFCRAALDFFMKTASGPTSTPMVGRNLLGLLVVLRLRWGGQKRTWDGGAPCWPELDPLAARRAH